MEICQSDLPIKPWMEEKTRKLPGIQPVKAGEWLLRDEVYAEQMAYRDKLLSEKRDVVFRGKENSREVQQELLETVISELDDDYHVDGNLVTRPDGVVVDVSFEIPIICAASLVQEDLLVLEMGGDEPELTAAVLCFPASWTLDQKFQKGLIGIHGNVDEYDVDMAKRVHRMFLAIRPEQPLWRANYLVYQDADLHQPRLEGQSRPLGGGGDKFMRVERQTLRKLPKSGAVVFGIHTFVVPLDILTDEEIKGIPNLTTRL